MVSVQDRTERSVVRSVAALAVARWASNTAVRFVLTYLPTIARGAGVSLGTAGAFMAAQQMAGIPGAWVGARADRTGAQRMAVAGAGAVGLAALIPALGGPLWLAVGLVAIGVAKPVFDTAMGAWIGAAVPYERRGRVLGLTEYAWALALLVGTPVLGVVIDVWSWQTAFVVVGLACLASAVLVAMTVPRAAVAATVGLPGRGPLPPAVRPVMASIALTGLGHQLVFVVHGAWLEDDLGLSVTGIGGAVVVLGIGELVGTSLVTAGADRFGKRRVAVAGFSALIPFLMALPLAGSSALIGLILLALVVASFEVGYIALMVVTSEIDPSRRATVIGWGVVAVTVGRSIGSLIGPWVWEAGGISGVAFIGGLPIAIGAALLTLTDDETGEHQPSAA